MTGLPNLARGIVAAGLGAAVLGFTALPTPASLFAASLAAVCAIIAYVDLDRFIIPDSASLAILGLGLAETLLRARGMHLLPALAESAMRCVAAGGVLWLTGYAYRRATGRDGLGFGDVKLAAAAGACLGWDMLPLALQLAVVLALLAIGGRALANREMPDRHAALPFGAFLAPAIWVAFVLERL
jgi:leader peptidase (prepilin peptidase) / N-methyltransferase